MATYTTSSAPLPWMEPYLQDYMSRAMDVANVPYQQSPGTYTPANNVLQQGWQATANRAMQGSPVMGAANAQLQNTLQGGWMNSNPYLDQSINAAQSNLVNQWNQVQKPQWDKAMQASGSFGNTGVQQYAAMDANNLQQNLANVSTNMRNNAYNTERNMMQNALTMAPGYANQDWNDIGQMLNAGQQMQGFNQAAQNQQQQWWQEAQNYAPSRLNIYGQALGMNPGTIQTQTQPDPSTASQLVGGGLTGLALWNALFGTKP